MAIDYFNQAVNIRQKMKMINLDCQTDELEIEICELKHSICKCRYKIRQFAKSQKESIDMTERAQLIVDLEESKNLQGPNYERAVLVIAKAYNL